MTPERYRLEILKSKDKTKFVGARMVVDEEGAWVKAAALAASENQIRIHHNNYVELEKWYFQLEAEKNALAARVQELEKELAGSRAVILDLSDVDAELDRKLEVALAASEAKVKDAQRSEVENVNMRNEIIARSNQEIKALAARVQELEAAIDEFCKSENWTGDVEVAFVLSQERYTKLKAARSAPPPAATEEA